jgi:hypothetical protein
MKDPLRNPTASRLRSKLVLVFFASFMVCRSSLADASPFTQRMMSGGTISDGLDVGTIRQGRHPTFDRLVFDVTNWEGAGAEAGKPAASPGHISISPLVARLEYAIELGGFRAFSAPMPAFSDNSRIASLKRRKGEAYEDDSTVALLIKFQTEFCYRVITLDDPARIVIDVGYCP